MENSGDLEMWEFHTAPINPNLATGRVRITVRFKDLPRQLKGLSEINSMKTLG